MDLPSIFLATGMLVVVLLGGLAAGFVQSLIVGLYVGRWDGGHGLLWGLALGIPSAAASLVAGWYALAAAGIVAVLICGGSIASIFVAERR